MPGGTQIPRRGSRSSRPFRGKQAVRLDVRVCTIRPRIALIVWSVNDARKLTPFRRPKTDPLLDLGLLVVTGGCWSWPASVAGGRKGLGIDGGRGVGAAAVAAAVSGSAGAPAGRAP